MEMKTMLIKDIDGRQANWAVANLKGMALRDPIYACDEDVEGKQVPFVLYEVVSTYHGDDIVSAIVTPVKVVRYGVNHEAGASAPSITFIGHDGRKALGSVDMFFICKEEAELEARHQTKGHVCDFTPVDDWTQCGQIIEEYGIMFRSVQHSKGLTIQAYLRSRGTSGPSGFGENHRIAALRCLLASEYGENVDVPSDLSNSD